MFKMSYKALSEEEWQFRGLLFRPLVFQDIEKIRRWRNSQTKYLRQQGSVSRLKQILYFFINVRKDVATKQPEKVLLGVVSREELIGYCGLVHIDWTRNEAEVSFLLSDATIGEDAYTEIMTCALLCLCEVARSLGLKWLRTETYVFPERENHIATLESFGFSTANTGLVQGTCIQSVYHRFELREGK